MSEPKRIPLSDRGVLAVTGPDARTFLQAIITNDVDRVDRASTIYAALLTPQGKFLFDFIIADGGDGGLLLDTGRDRIAELAERLDFYRLRADVGIRDVSGERAVTALIGDGAAALARLHARPGNARHDGDTCHMVDPRLAALGVRCLHRAGDEPFPQAGEGTPDDYDGLRMALAVPEAGTDVLIDKSFILESNFEELNAVDFGKGCYVGQELTARTKFRGTVRRRLFGVTAQDGNLPPPGTPVTVGSTEIGELRSTRGPLGIALIRTDRLDEAGGEKAEAMAGDVRVIPARPDWVAP